MATLYEWKDAEGDLGTLEIGDFGTHDYEITATLTVQSDRETSVYLTRPQAKKLRKALKRALASDLP